MSYSMEFREAEFEIKADKAKGALRAIQSLDPSKGSGRDYRVSGLKRGFAWVETSEYRSAENLGEAFHAWCWDVRENSKGDWILNYFDGRNLGDESHLFSAAAPFVTPGSWIEMLGEDGERWRWVFDGETCKEKSPTISWE